MSDPFNIEPLVPLIPAKPVRRKDPDKEDKNKNMNKKKKKGKQNGSNSDKESTEDKHGQIHIDEFI